MTEYPTLQHAIELRDSQKENMKEVKDIQEKTKIIKKELEKSIKELDRIIRNLKKEASGV